MNEQKKIKSPFKKDGLFNEANPVMFEIAKDLRKNMTHAEMILWNNLKAGINGLKFRRQHPIGIYVADFYCHKIKLIIEIDGSIHNKPETKNYDIKREKDLVDWGYKLIRFSNDEVNQALEKVLLTIKIKVEELTKLNSVPKL